MKISNEFLYKIVSELIQNFSEYKDSYEIRLQTQKIIYLFEVLNKSNFYDFSWYLAGPYSSELSRQIFDSIIDDKNNQREWARIQLSPKALEIINKINQCIDEANKLINDSLDRTKLLELIGSIVYISKNYVISTTENRYEIIEQKLKANKPQFADVINLRELIIYLVNSY